MVSVVENWTEMEGKVLSFKPSQAFLNFLELEVTIEKTRDVEGFPNLLKNTEGETVGILMPKELAAKLSLENTPIISFRARSGKHHIFAHPDFGSVLKRKLLKLRSEQVNSK